MIESEEDNGCSGLPCSVIESWGRPGLLTAQQGWEHHQQFPRRSDTVPSHRFVLSRQILAVLL